MDIRDADVLRNVDPSTYGGLSDPRRAVRAIPESITRAFAQDLVAQLARQSSKIADRDVSDIPSENHAPTELEIAGLCDALVSEDPERAAVLIDDVRRKGRTPDTIYLRYIAAAARQLGERWVTDEASFLEVTLGLARLHGVLRELGPNFFSDQPVRPLGLSALFAPAPEETHMLGVTMATDFFRRAGWTVDLQLTPSLHALRSHASERNYALIGLSAGCRAVIPSLQDAVRAVRKVRPEATIAIGGYLTELEPDIARMTGADVIANDVSIAPVSLETVVKQAQGH